MQQNVDCPEENHNMAKHAAKKRYNKLILTVINLS
jgi:hypothetical protein